MKDRIRGGAFTDGARILFVKPTKEGYELTEKGVRGIRKVHKDDIASVLFVRGFKKVM